MNILIPNSWLKDYLETNATPKEFATAMSLTSVSIERMEKVDDDIVYDIEVTTNRPDLMSIIGIAREASAVLPQQGFKAKFKPRTIDYYGKIVPKDNILNIEIDPTLVNRIVAIVLDITLGPSPKIIADRLTKSGIRSINNVVDVTNYIMREIGHPSHVFDYDRIPNHTLIIRRSKKGEKITTLDDKEYELAGEDIVADDGKGNIVDLLGIMGTANSVVTDDTKRIILFLDNNNPHLLRKTSMGLGIRTEAAVLNEKGLNPDIMFPTLLHGLELLKEFAHAKAVSPIIDMYPNKVKPKTITVTKEKIDATIGIEIPQKTIVEILESLGFTVSVTNTTFKVEVFTSRINDIDIPEDIIEEVARVYGYHKIPNNLPSFAEQDFYHQEKNEFYWIKKIKQAFLYWGYNETYTYSMVSEEQFDGPIENAIALRNPLTEDRVYLRNSLVPSLLEVCKTNKNREELCLFEISNVYLKTKGLPNEVLTLAGLLKGRSANFSNTKGVVERVFQILGIKDFTFERKEDGLDGAIVTIGKERIGTIEILDVATFEMNFASLLKHANAKKVYQIPPKFPPIIEDIRVEIPPKFTYEKVRNTIVAVDSLVNDVSLLDVFQNKRTFRITYLNKTRNLTNEDIVPVREKIIKVFEKEFEAAIS